MLIDIGLYYWHQNYFPEIWG